MAAVLSAAMDGYVKVLLSLVKGMARTAEALRDARPDAILVHVEDVGIERAGTTAMAAEAAEAQARRLLPLDLACGRVVAGASALRSPHRARRGGEGTA